MGDPADLSVFVLGGVHAVAADGRRVDVGPAKCQIVLGALALSAGSPVPTSRLIELVWAADPPRSAERTLQSYIARLRRGLGSDAISRHGASYRLDVDPLAVDVHRFETHLDAGRIDEALVEWGGPPLDGLEAPGLAPVVTALGERWIGAVETALAERVDHNPAAAVPELTELTARHPFREGLWALLMTALYRSGRQADALAAYRSATEHLVDQLGLEPGPQLRELELMVLGHDERLQGSTGTGGQHEIGGIHPAGSGARPTGTVTFAFVEIADVGERRSPTETRSAVALADHRQRIHDLATRCGGVVFSAVDDRFGLAFHRPSDAIVWARRLQETSDGRLGDGSLIGLRVGIHSGEADDHESGYFGPAVNLATTLASVGHGGQTLISDAVAAMLPDSEIRELGVFQLDGILGEQHIHQLGDLSHPPIRSERRRRGNAPKRAGRLFGRDELLASLEQALRDHRLVTLVGPGGIGKTSVAMTVAASAGVPLSTTNGGREVWIVELASVGSGEHVRRAVADTLGIADRAGADLNDTILERLTDRSALLILDNCEHVIDAVAEFAETVLRNSPTTGLLATSRERLGVNNERVVTVGPLDPAHSAVDLFLERVAAADHAGSEDISRPDAIDICRRLDGIPLAVELAAARVGSLSPAELLARLDQDQGLRLLAGGRRSSAGDRHQTLRAAIGWSYDLLDPAERMLFRRLSVFTGVFDLSAAESVAADPAATAGDVSAAVLDPVDVDRVLGDLVDRSMVVAESGPFGRRFRLLEPIREYGAERLGADGHASAIAARHVDWCRGQVRHIGRLLAGWHEIEGVARLDDLWPNLRAAFDRASGSGDHRLARELLRPIVSEIVLRSRNEIGDWMERLLEVTPPDDPDGVVFGLYWAAHRYAVGQNPDGYERLLDRHGEPDHLLMRHGRAFVLGDHATMVDLMPLVTDELRRQGEHLPAERAKINRATALLNTGRFDEHEELALRLVERYRETGPPTFLNWTLTSLGYGAAFRGRVKEADGWFDQAVGVAVPARTHTPTQAHEARRVFRGGDHGRAFRILRDHVGTILDTDNMQVGLIAAIEYVNMMVAIKRLPEAAWVVRHLETTGLFDAPEWRELVAPTALTAAASPGAESGHDVLTDRREAFIRIAHDLDELLH